MSVYIRPWVLGLSMFSEDPRSNLKHLGDQFEEGVVGKMLLGKLSLTHVARISLTQYSVTKPGDNLEESSKLLYRNRCCI